MIELIYFIIYYLSLPIISIIFIFLIKTKYDELTYVSRISNKESLKRKIRPKDDIYDEIKKYKVIFIVALLVLIPVWNVTTYEYTDLQMHKEMLGGVTSPKGPAFAVLDPIVRQIGPSFDAQEVIDEMESKPDIWFTDQVKEQMDLYKYTKYPGKLSVYRTNQNQYFVIFAYVSPVPVIESYIFILDDKTFNKTLILMNHKTLIYPMNPDDAGRVL